MSELTNKLFIRFAKRAEKIERKTLIDSFVNVGPLLTVLQTKDNQILYGRRGTGKTHALIYLTETVKKNGGIAIYIDLRTIGSTGGIYSDNSLNLAERATRLLMDTLAGIHDELMDIFLDDSYGFNLSEMGPILDDFAAAITEVSVKGTVEQEEATGSQTSREATKGLRSEVSTKSLKVDLHSETKDSSEEHITTRFKASGNLEYRVHFGRVGNILNRICERLGRKRFWILFDEWSVVPLDLQPYLADLLRRSIFPVGAISVKIGAIEKRSSFQIPLERGDYIGIELGGDALADLNMDDFMVFDNDENKALAFYKELIHKHFSAIAEEEGINDIPSSSSKLISEAFTQENVFKEFVRAAEGVPRDAFNILSLAAQKSFNTAINMNTLRSASKVWYQRDKESSVAADSKALKLLHWIIDKVIAHRRARAFLLERSVAHSLIDKLFDARVLHLLKQNISAHDKPGVRFDAYKIDYGCYVDLLSTAMSPEGLLAADEGGYVNVPPDDYRSIRRAILNLDEFEKST